MAVGPIGLGDQSNTDEVALGEFGIPGYYGTVIWTFGRRLVTMYEYNRNHSFERLTENLRYTGLFIYNRYQIHTESQTNALFLEEAANTVASYPFMRDINLTAAVVIDCCRYGFFLRRNSRNTFGLEWAAHAPNFWICDGIIPEGDRAREISNALDLEIKFSGDDSLLRNMFVMTDHSESSHLLVEDEDDGNIDKYKKRPYRWIYVNSKNKVLKDNMQTMLTTASSIFLSFDKTSSAPKLPNALFKQCSKLGVLILSYCAFSFISPPFLHCNTLRFLGLGNCTHQNNNTSELEGGDCITKWTLFRQNLLVFDLRYTDWGEILSEENIALMANLIELNIQGVRRSWQYMGQLLQTRLPYLQRLRIIKPTHQEETSMDIDNSFVDKQQLEILDLSGNRDMKSLPGSLSEASKLQVLVLDGCDGLENVVLANSSLRSFSFDGYGPTSHWTSTGKLPPMSSRPEHRPSVVDKDVRANKISLEGCTLLEDLFLRGLPNLEELDLSGCAIKVLDFEAMVLDVPRLKRLFLQLGCKNLCAIKWGTDEQRPKLLELICIDTWPRVGCARPLSLCVQQKSFKLQVHAIFADARLARCLWAPICSTFSNAGSCYFNISITPSAACMETIQPAEATTNKEKVTGSNDHQRHYGIAARHIYGDVFTKVGDGPAPMQAFPQGPTGQLDCHMEITGDGSRSVQSEVEADPDGANLATLMRWLTQSLHVHDVSTCSNTMPTKYWESLRWCRVERCPNLHAVFPPGAEDWDGKLETIWASDLLMARCVWSRGLIDLDHFRSLRHLHLRCCPSLQYGLAMGGRPSFPSLETIHCGELRHIFVSGDKKYQHTSVEFPKLTTIHLHDLPALQQICEAAEMLVPALETIKIRGCWSLRRLPALKGREPGMRRPTVGIIEKDVWDGVDAGHHPSLYEVPVHSRYYKRRMLRTTVLR